ncbi:hypothetical protein BGP76_11750 [Reichenbachiella sp. MSK19-1]|nr:hypothetical protein BGP76_11750 [Reichenbachiella sp. MSK19-1]
MSSYQLPKIVAIILLLSSCQKKGNEIRHTDIQINKNQHVDFCYINNGNWDTIIIIPPYSKLDLLYFKDEAYMDKVSKIQSIDWINMLLIKKDEIEVGYIEVPRSYLDFKTSNFSYITRNNCSISYHKTKESDVPLIQTEELTLTK